MTTQAIELKPEIPEDLLADMKRNLTGDEQPCADHSLSARIEALLMTTSRPLTEARLAELLGLSGKGTAKSIRAAIDELNEQYESGGRAFRAQQVAGGWQLYTQPDFAPLLNRLHAAHRESKLSQPALETLSIIAYRQPIMRAEIEAIRGVACGEVLRALLERRLVKIVGRAEQLGRPMLYGTTPQFLKVFGLPGLDALPSLEGDVPSALSAAPGVEAEAQTEAKPGAEPAEAELPSDADGADGGEDTGQAEG